MKMYRYIAAISCISFFISCSPVNISEEEVSEPVKTSITYTLPTTRGFTEYIQLNFCI